MHQSSMVKLEAFLSVYARESSGNARVLDIGSASYEGHISYRDACKKAGLNYVGLDMQSGLNVDIVSKRPCLYTEVESEEFEYVISGQTFEHNPYFWISFCEMARVLKQGGYVFVVAPSAGIVHRYPFDCWRFYPDSWSALCALSGLIRIETIFEPDENKQFVKGVQWKDSAIIAKKPVFNTKDESDLFYNNIREITLPFFRSNFDLEVAVPNKGPAYSRYLEMIRNQK